MATQLERTIDELFAEQAEELSIRDFRPFYVSDYHLLNSKVIKEFNVGKSAYFQWLKPR